MVSFEEMVEKDVELMFLVQSYCRRHPRLDGLLQCVTSKHPWRDISSIIWIVHLLGVLEIGRSHFWIVLINLVAVTVARRVIEAKRPFEVDRHLQPLTDTSAESYPFPSTESYMSIIIFGHLLVASKLYLLVMLFLPLTLLIGFSRVYSRSRFPHQILGSWALAILGLIFSPLLYHSMKIPDMHDMEHGGYLAFVGLCIVSYFAISMENNDSQLLGVKKEEFKRVIQDILKGGGEGEGDVREGGDDSEEDDDSNNMIYSTTSATSGSTSKTKKASVRAAKQLRHDSFYYLQKSLEEREKLRQQGGGGDDSPSPATATTAAGYSTAYSASSIGSSSSLKGRRSKVNARTPFIVREEDEEEDEHDEEEYHDSLQNTYARRRNLNDGSNA
eukprot:gene1733-1893_t